MFALYNIRIGQIRLFLTEHAAQLLVQALIISWLDYCNALLAGLPSNTIKPLQIIQNAAARLVFNEPKRAHVAPLFISLNWLLVAACIKFKTLILAFRTNTGTATYYFKSLLLSHHHSTSALVSEILMSVLQTVQKKKKTIYIWTDSAKKTTNNLHMDRQCKKNCTGAFTVLQTVQKKQQQFTYGQYIFTDCTEDNVQNTHTYTQNT